ncbi:MAG: exopolysaccharide biosynthesis polyprenyl glycosylphosphotransferase [Verrucomicrobiales bacterium]|nr:exopolysaccharide biosynthesis polyprenyl glycosylphosphotransferase [Verrucomicrobiales bacterium]
MFSSRSQGITRLHFVFQLAGVLALVWIIYPAVNWIRFGGELKAHDYVLVTGVLIVAALLEILTRPGETKHLSGLSRSQVTAVTHRQTLFALVSVFGTMVMLKDNSLSRAFLALFFPFYFVWIAWSNRTGYRMLHRTLYRNRGKGLSKALLIGPRSAVSRYCDNPNPVKPPGTDILGYVAVDSDIFPAANGAIALPQIGVISDLQAICEETKARALLLLGLTDRKDLVPPLTQISSELGLRTMWLDDVDAHYGTGSQAYHSANYSVVTRLREPLEDPVNRCIKRFVDFVGSGIAVALFLPPMILAVGLIHRFQSPGPLFYRQKRSGRNGETFEMLKFRSMHVEDPNREFEQAKQDDPRVFRGGLLLRKWSIDELPQLINVFRGEMSLVGPRPHPLPLDERLATESGVYRLRNLAKPGITGLAQCRGWRGETRRPDQVRNRVRLDLFYIQHWSIGFDFRIMAETVRQLVFPPDSAC